jgi:hypothetical protein
MTPPLMLYPVKYAMTRRREQSFLLDIHTNGRTLESKRTFKIPNGNARRWRADRRKWCNLWKQKDWRKVECIKS